MKKRILLTLGIILAVLTACGKGQPLLNAADYELNTETRQTSKGISIGDGPAAFLDAYGAYEIVTSADGSSYQAYPADEIPFTDNIETILPTFFIDGLPTTIEQICEDNGIERADLLTLLSSDEYLGSHTVLYYYMIFTWENGVITDIHSEYMDYNEDASYYENLN